jgi:hypothetical protein
MQPLLWVGLRWHFLQTWNKNWLNMSKLLIIYSMVLQWKASVPRPFISLRKTIFHIALMQPSRWQGRAGCTASWNDTLIFRWNSRLLQELVEKLDSTRIRWKGTSTTWSIWWRSLNFIHIASLTWMRLVSIWSQQKNSKGHKLQRKKIS